MLKIKCRALFDFMGQSHEELSFKKGDVLIILDEPFEGWLEAQLNDQRGLIPSNYVQPLQQNQQNQQSEQRPPLFSPQQLMDDHLSENQ